MGSHHFSQLWSRQQIKSQERFAVSMLEEKISKSQVSPVVELAAKSCDIFFGKKVVSDDEMRRRVSKRLDHRFVRSLQPCTRRKAFSLYQWLTNVT